MSKSEISYYDWKLTFKKKVDENTDFHKNSKSHNSLGIPNKEFTEYLKNWMKKNL
ncbi:MAG: hypothetical protein KGD57_03080 [Candidatus Lokiarchaeota archaeon]|nr:hypothetical protein [Candidatus Lokiarchaeota archaeon]